MKRLTFADEMDEPRSAGRPTGSGEEGLDQQDGVQQEERRRANDDGRVSLRETASQRRGQHGNCPDRQEHRAHLLNGRRLERFTRGRMHSARARPIMVRLVLLVSSDRAGMGVEGRCTDVRERHHDRESNQEPVREKRECHARVIYALETLGVKTTAIWPLLAICLKRWSSGRRYHMALPI